MNPETNQVGIYESPDGKIRVEVRFEDENLWLSQKLMAELFGVNVRIINEHLQNIFRSNELQENSVIRKFRITAADGKNYTTKFYSLEAIIAVGYRVNSDRGSQFRMWATERLKEYILKGYAIDTAPVSTPAISKPCSMRYVRSVPANEWCIRKLLTFMLL